MNDGSLSVMKRTIQSYTEKGLPVGIQLDAYECPWNVAYKHVHFHHYVLALGYQDGILFCQDPFCYIYKIALHADAQLKIGRDYYTYKIHNTKELHPNERIILLKESIRHYLSSKSYRVIIERVQQIIKRELSLPTEVNPYNGWNSDNTEYL